MSPAARRRFAARAPRRVCVARAEDTARAEDAAADAADDAPFRPHAGTGDDVTEEAGEEVPLDLVGGYLDNAKVRPKIDIDADDYMLMWRLRTMLHKDDFKRIFDKKSYRIGEF